MCLFLFFEGVVTLNDPVVWITIATVSSHSPYAYTAVSLALFWSQISFWDSQSSVQTREGPLASRPWVTPCQRNAWREERAVQPLSLDHCLEKQHILFQTRSHHRVPQRSRVDLLFVWPRLSLSSWRHRDNGNLWQQLDFLPHALRTHKHSSFLIHLITSWSNLPVFSSEETAKLLISLPQKRKLYPVVNDRNRALKTRSSNGQARLEFISLSYWIISYIDNCCSYEADIIASTTVKALFQHWQMELTQRYWDMWPSCTITTHNCSQFWIHSILVRSPIVRLVGRRDELGQCLRRDAQEFCSVAPWMLTSIEYWLDKLFSWDKKMWSVDMNAQSPWYVSCERGK